MKINFSKNKSNSKSSYRRIINQQGRLTYLDYPFEFKAVYEKQDYIVNKKNVKGTGYSIYIIKAPEREFVSLNNKQFHIVTDRYGNNKICVTKLIKSISEVEAIIKKWTKQYVNTIDNYIIHGGFNPRVKDKPKLLPCGTFRINK